MGKRVLWTQPRSVFQQQLRTIENDLSLNRRQASVLEFLSRRIGSFTQLKVIALEIKELEDFQLMHILNNRSPVDTSHTLHF